MADINQISQEDVLALIALREVLGGFAHEIAQPLNAIMMASQVVQLGIRRSTLLEEEKYYIAQRLDILSSQVHKAGNILEGIRSFTRKAASETGQIDVEQVFEGVYQLMGQQISGRGIEVVWESKGSLPSTDLDLRTVKCLVVHGLAFARDSVEALGDRHDKEGISYRRLLEIKLFPANGNSALDIRWNPGSLLENTQLVDPPSYLGIVAASSVISSLGGVLETSPGNVMIRFP